MDIVLVVFDKNLMVFIFSGYDNVNNISMSMKNNGYIGEGVKWDI